MGGLATTFYPSWPGVSRPSAHKRCPTRAISRTTLSVGVMPVPGLDPGINPGATRTAGVHGDHRVKPGEDDEAQVRTISWIIGRTIAHGQPQ